MSQASLHQALCRLLAQKGGDSSTLLQGAIADVLACMPVRGLMLGLGEAQNECGDGLAADGQHEYGDGFAREGERLPLSSGGELWVAFAEDLTEVDRAPLRDLLTDHFAACLSVAGWHDQVASAHRGVEESQAQIVHASKMAAVGQLAAGVAHELNSPLGSVILQLDAATLNLERQRYEKVADKLASAARAAATAKEIISKLLFYSRSATAGMDAVNLNDVVGDTLSMLGKQLSYENLDLRVTLGELPAIEASRSELQQVITNLLLNARDALLEALAPVRTVEVATWASESEVCLEVRDTGPGIPAHVLGKVFSPFFTTKPAGQGTGLGLSVSLTIVEQHGGRLTASNGPAGGARFLMTLPVAGQRPLVSAFRELSDGPIQTDPIV